MIYAQEETTTIETADFKKYRKEIETMIQPSISWHNQTMHESRKKRSLQNVEDAT